MDSGGSLVIAHPPLVQSTFSDDNRRVLVSLDGAETVTEYQITATSVGEGAGQPNSSTFQLFPQQSLILEKKILLRATVTLTQVAGAARALSDYGEPVPVSYPLNSAIESLQVKVNGHTFTSNPKYFKHLWERLYPAKMHQQYNSFTPTMRDNDYPLNQMINSALAGIPGGDSGEVEPYAAGDAGTVNYNVIRNGPFSLPNDGEAFLESRKTFPINRTVAGTRNTLVYTFTEPLLIDLFEMFEEAGLINIKQLEITINWAQDAFSRMFSNTSSAQNVILATLTGEAAGPTLGLATNFNCNFTKATHQILARYVTPSQNLSRKNNLTIPYQSLQRFIQPAIFAYPNNAGLSGVCTFNSMISNVIPRYIILSVRQDPNDTSLFIAPAGGTLIANTNGFAMINNVSITIDNTPSILANATPEQLYEISERNGFSGSFAEWAYRGQGFFIAELGKDIGGYVPGTAMAITIQPTIKFTNQFVAGPGRQVATQMVNVIGECFFITDGFATINYDQVTEQQGLSVSDVAEALSEDPVSVDMSGHGPERSGKGFGSVFRTVRNVFGAIAKPVSGILGMLPHPGAQVASNVLSGADRALNGGKLHHRAHHESHEHEHHHHRRHKSGAGKLMA